MPNRKAIIHFAVVTLVVYAVLMAPIPGWQRTYGAVFRAVANRVYGDLFAGGKVSFVPRAIKGGANDFTVMISNPSNRGTLEVDGSTRYTGYQGPAMLIALVVASPIPWRRRGRALLIGLIVLHGFIALRLGVWLTHHAAHEQIALVSRSGVLFKALEVTYELLVHVSVNNFAAPVVIWILTTFRREDWQAQPISKVSKSQMA